MGFYDYSVPKAKGGVLEMKDLKGKVVIVVNTATGCGFTPQYKELEEMYEKFHEKGLEIVDVPCNQFGGQTPGTDDEVHEFCTLHYHTQFAQMKKSDVNGEKELDLFRYLKGEKGFAGFDEHKYKEFFEKMYAEKDPEWASNPDIKWNFTKFIVDREGKVVARFEPTADMAKVEECVEKLI